MDILSKYRKLGIDLVEKPGSDEALAKCPLHEDDAPSLAVNLKTGLWYCHAEAIGGTYEQLIHRIEETRITPIPDSIVDGYHEALLNQPEKLTEVYNKRGLTLETIKKFKLGIAPDEARITIPIRHGDVWVNVRQHASFKQASPKVVSYKTGYGKIRLFPEEALKGQEILVCEGELKAILAQQLGFNAVSPTGGAQHFNAEWVKLFKDKDVVVIYDIDNPGRAGALKLCKLLTGTAKTIKNVLLPIDKPHKDLPDYILQTGATAVELRKLIDSTPQYTDGATDLGPAHEVSLSQAGDAKFTGKRVRMKIMVTGKDLAPYTIPRKVKILCAMSNPKICSFCPVSESQGELVHEFELLSKDVLNLIDCNEGQQVSAIKGMLQIPSKCCGMRLEVMSWHNIEELKLLPKIDYCADPNQEYVVRQAYFLGHNVTTNQAYQVDGLALAHPKTQHVTFLLDKMLPSQDSLVGFKLSDKDFAELSIFKTDNLEAKWEDICRDLTANITKIYCRHDIIKAVELIYHSPLQFKFMGEAVIKGWTEGLIVGDTRTGKSETMHRLMAHFRHGELVTGENTSFAGLVGGMQQNNNRWSITWGVLPRNNGRLIALDEVSGMPVDDIGRLSGVRSSGIAEITKIQTERTFAKTRIIWLGNARSSRAINTYASGVNVIKELIGRPEDIARFDFALIVASQDVPVEVINAQEHETRQHVYTSELCHKLISWIWSRNLDQIILSKNAEKMCLAKAKELAAKYTADLPLVEPSEQRIKLARLACAVAGRFFNTPDGITLMVEAEHVEMAANLLDSWYSKPAFNYGGYSRIKNKELTLTDTAAVRNRISTYGRPCIEMMLDTNIMKLQDICDITMTERIEAQTLVCELIRNGAMKRRSVGYIKTPGFIRLLREMLESEDEIKSDVEDRI